LGFLGAIGFEGGAKPPPISLQYAVANTAVAVAVAVEGAWNTHCPQERSSNFLAVTAAATIS